MYVRSEICYEDDKGYGVHSDTDYEVSADGNVDSETKKFLHELLDEYLSQPAEIQQRGLFYVGNYFD